MSDARPEFCRVNRCGRPLGIGTHMTIAGNARTVDQTLPVCEEHWQALRDIFPVEPSSVSP
jgi:hypothetical protein